MTGLIAGTAAIVIAGLAVCIAHLGRNNTRLRERAAAAEAAQHLPRRLPTWAEFLNPAPGLPAEAVGGFVEQIERYANGEGR